MKKTIFIHTLLFISIILTAKDAGSIYIADGANFFLYSTGTDSFILTRAKIGEKNFNSILEHLASGKRINSAGDDPSGLAVAEKMDSMLEQIKRESMNDEDMRNLHNFVESAIAQDQDIVQRIRELVISSTNGILGPDDRDIIQTEINELVAQIDMNARFTQFNKIDVIPELTSVNLGLDKIDVIRNPETAIGITDSALKTLSVKRVMQGIKSNLLTYRIEGKSYYYINMMESESRITDLDMSEGISELIKNSVLIKTRYGLLMKGK